MRLISNEQAPMIVYLIALTAALIAAFLNDRMTPALRKSILIIICIYIILLMGFRYKVGIDTISYMKAYRYIPPLDHLSLKAFSQTRFEPGFFILCSLCKTFTREFWPFQLLMAAITNGCIFYFLYRYCRNVFTGVTLYFIFSFLYFTTEVMRESAAVGIFLLNYRNLQEKRWARYYLISVISILFHFSAIIILFFPLARLLNNKFIFYTSCIVFIGITPLVEKLNDILQIAAISGRIALYASGADDLNFNWRIAELIRSAFPAIAILAAYHFAKKECEFKIMLLLQILFCMGAFAIPLIFSRFSNYTVIFVVAAAANVLSLETLKQWIKICFISFVLLTQVNYYHINYERWFPYISIFQPDDLPVRASLYRTTFLPWLRYVR